MKTGFLFITSLFILSSCGNPQFNEAVEHFHTAVNEKRIGTARSWAEDVIKYGPNTKEAEEAKSFLERTQKEYGTPVVTMKTQQAERVAKDAKQKIQSDSHKGSVDRNIAYTIAKEFAKDRFGSADYGWGDDGFVDMGDNEYYVTGIADIPGKRYRWTADIVYNGGDVYDRNNWTIKGFTKI